MTEHLKYYNKLSDREQCEVLRNVFLHLLKLKKGEHEQDFNIFESEEMNKAYQEKLVETLLKTLTEAYVRDSVSDM